MSQENIYETAELTGQYMLFHFADEETLLPFPFGPREHTQFPVKIVENYSHHFDLIDCERALDLGCAVGRSSFELSKDFEEVIGIDYSAAFIELANEVKSADTPYPYQYKVQGHRYESAKVALDENWNRDRVLFETGDAMSLREDLGSFDLVVASNLICRLTEPMKFFNRLPQLVRPGGLFILSSPFTYMEEFTPLDNWLGGTDKTGTAFSKVSEVLDEHFEMLEYQDIPMLIREHERKYQWTVCHTSLWKRFEDS